MISYKTKGNYSKMKNSLRRMVRNAGDFSFLDKYGKEGVKALEEATPKESGKTASCWTYDIRKKGKCAVISFNNTNVNHGVSIALIIEYGHATRNGGWIEGYKYISPAIQPIFKDMLDRARKEVRK